MPSLTPLAPTCTCTCLHAPVPTSLQHCSHRRERNSRLLQLWWLFPLFKLSVGPTPPAFPPILSCVPSRLHFTNCFVSLYCPSSLPQPPRGFGITVSGTMGMFTDPVTANHPGLARLGMDDVPTPTATSLSCLPCCLPPALLPSSPPASRLPPRSFQHHSAVPNWEPQSLVSALFPFPQPHAHTQHSQIARPAGLVAGLLCFALRSSTVAVAAGVLRCVVFRRLSQSLSCSSLMISVCVLYTLTQYCQYKILHSSLWLGC
jgi:hypothetical protein